MGSLTSGGSTIAGADAHVDVRFTAASCVCLAVVLGVLGLADVHVANGGVDCSTVLGLAGAYVANGDVDCSAFSGLADALWSLIVDDSCGSGDTVWPA